MATELPPATSPTGPSNHYSCRLRKGTKAEDAYVPNLSSSSNSEPILSLSQIDSSFQVQEYIAFLVRQDPHDVDRIVDPPTRPETEVGKGKDLRRTGEEKAVGGEGEEMVSMVDRDVWLYEQLRRLALDLSNPFVTSLQAECTRDSCPEMKAGEWLYLCAAHAAANETECCAIDYITHTLDGATALLNSARYFPSRMSIPSTSLKHFTSIARRLYRIFAHAWYHHREVFDNCEAETSLYDRFITLISKNDLISPDSLVIPPPTTNPSSEGTGTGGRE